MKDPERKVSKSGNEFVKVTLMVDPATENSSPTWWDLTIMAPLADKLPDGLLEKFRFLKATGLGSERDWTDRNGNTRRSNDLLVSGIEMQNGEFISNKKSNDEDAPF